MRPWGYGFTVITLAASCMEAEGKTGQLKMVIVVNGGRATIRGDAVHGLRWFR